MRKVLKDSEVLQVIFNRETYPTKKSIVDAEVFSSIGALNQRIKVLEKRYPQAMAKLLPFQDGRKNNTKDVDESFLDDLVGTYGIQDDV